MYPSTRVWSFCRAAAHWTWKNCCQPTTRGWRLPGCQVIAAVGAHPPRRSNAATATGRNRRGPSITALRQDGSAVRLHPVPREHGHIVRGRAGRHGNAEEAAPPRIDLIRSPGDDLPQVMARGVVARDEQLDALGREIPVVGDVALHERLPVPRGAVPLDAEELLPAQDEGLAMSGRPAGRRGEVPAAGGGLQKVHAADAEEDSPRHGVS